jgi:hypothetical protein
MCHAGRRFGELTPAVTVDGAVAMGDWTEFGLRQLPIMSAVEPFSSPPDMPAVIEG